MQWQQMSAQWAAMMQMENLRLQQIAAMQSAMIDSMSQEMAKKSEETCTNSVKAEEGTCRIERPAHSTARKLIRPLEPSLEPMKIATPETLSPQSTSSLSAFSNLSYLSPLPSPALSEAMPHLSAPPGLELSVQREASENSIGTSEDLESLKHLTITTSKLQAGMVTHILWSIAHPQAKLQVSCGSALVSPSFTANSTEGLRLLFSPGESWWHEFQAKKAKKGKRRAERLPRFGALHLKLSGDIAGGAEVTLVFTVGGVKQSPMKVTPGHSTCLTCELDRDWRRETDSTDGSLKVGVDIICGEPRYA
eukprot:Skav224911  [mRNA]  locus=scaffold1112:525658:531059:- [translate_table: standard]